MNKKLIGIILIIILILILIFSVQYFTKSTKIKETNFEENKSEENSALSNIIEDVEYSSKDTSGNEYTIRAEEGETDISNTNIIFLKK